MATLAYPDKYDLRDLFFLVAESILMDYIHSYIASETKLLFSNGKSSLLLFFSSLFR